MSYTTLTHDPDLVADVDGLGLVRPVLLLDGHQVRVSGHGECRPQRQHGLVTRVQGLQHRLVSEMNTALERWFIKALSYLFLGRQMSVAPVVMCITIPRMVGIA